MTYQQFQLLMIFWQMGIVDTFNVLKLCVNCGSQYVGIVLSSAAGNFSDIGPKVLLEPVLGLGTSYQFVKAAATAAERRQRITTLASFLAASGGALSTDPTFTVENFLTDKNLDKLGLEVCNRSISSEVIRNLVCKIVLTK